MSENNRNDKNQESINSWNTALCVGYINVSLMESDYSISMKKRDLSNIERHRLIGEHSLNDNNIRKFEEEHLTNEILENEDRDHKRRMMIMKEDVHKEKIKLRNDIKSYEDKIELYNKEINRYIAKKVPTNEDFEFMSRKINLAEEEFNLLKDRKYNTHSSDKSKLYLEDDHPHSSEYLKRLLDSTSPNIF